jgi:dihydrofolate reductase
MTISLIAAVSQNYVIGKNNQLVWRLPADMKYFKDVTEGHHVLMGRKNYLSIPGKFRPLSNRINIVVTHEKAFKAEGCVVVHSMEEGIDYAKKQGEKELFVIGGGEIYRQTIDLADKLYITWVHSTFEGDTFFPEINFDLWKETYRKDCQPDEKHKFAYSFCIYEKRKNN